MADAKLAVNILPPNIKRVQVKIVGQRPLIMNRWPEKARKEMLDKHMGKAIAKKKQPKRPKKIFEASLHVFKKGEFTYLGDKIGRGEVLFTGKLGIPAHAIKSAIVSATRNTGAKIATLLKGAVFIRGSTNDLIPIEYETLRLREDMVRLSGIGRNPDIRFRGEISGWSADIPIEFNGDVLTLEQVVNLLAIAGFSVGLLEMRPDKTGFDYGTFVVQKPKGDK